VCADVTVMGSEFLRNTVPVGTCVGLANHLCGDALDCAIRATVEAWPGGENGTLSAFLAATCCHHKISWDKFIGRSQFVAWGFGRDHFEQVRRWSRLAPRRSRESSTRARVVEEAELLGISPAEAASLGVSCRILLDRARMNFLAKIGFETRLLHHVPFDATADNVLLVAVAPRRDTSVPSDAMSNGIFEESDRELAPT